MVSDDLLRVFLAIARAGSVTGAGQALDMAQPTVSRKLAALESSLGTLFRRHGRGLSLSSAGLSLHDAIATHFDAIDSACDALHHDPSRLPGVIRIAAVHTLSDYFLPPLIARFAQQFPLVRIQAMGRSSAEVAQLVENREADLGLAYDVSVTSEQLHCRPLHDEHMVLVHHPALGPTLDQNGRAILDEHYALVGFYRGYALQSMLEKLVPERLNIGLQVETMDLLLAAVRQKIAGAVVASQIPPTTIEQTGLVRTPLAGPAVKRRVVLVSNKNATQGLAVSQFADMAQQMASRFKPGDNGEQ